MSILVLILFSIGFCGYILAFQMPTKGKVSCDALNVREGPGTNFSVVGVISLGTEVAITGISGNWFKVNVQEYSGKYVYSGYIDVTENSEISDNEAAKNPYPTLLGTDPKKPSTLNIDSSLSPKSDF